MPFCLHHKEAEHPIAPPTSSKLRHKKKICVLRSTPYYQRDAGVPSQQNNEKEKGMPAETRQALALVVNRLPVPIVHQSELTTVAGLLSVFSRNETMKIEAKYKSESARSVEMLSSFAFSDHLSERENTNEIQARRNCSQLHMACRLSHPAPFVTRLLADGATVNQPNSFGHTPLHVLILSGNWNASTKDALDSLIWRGASVSIADDRGDTPLLCIRHLLKEKQYDTADLVAQCLLEAGAYVDAVDAENLTLLSYSMQHLDSSLGLTKTLFNYGATVWGSHFPMGDDSAFKWLLKGIMQQRKLSNCSRSMKLVGQLMCDQPSQMELLVIRTMTRHSRCYQVYGPLFIGIQLEMKKFWKEPQRLTHLSRLAIRGSFTESASDSVTQLRLPQLVENYVLLNDSALGE